jgi:hypothetical protein
LTVAPKSWTVERTTNEPGVSKYMVNKARTLRKEQGIVAEPAESLEENFLKKLYRNEIICEDKFFEMCPRKIEYVSQNCRLEQNL